jgi:hypothetical protein
MTSEALVNLRAIVDGAVEYAGSERLDASGKTLPPQLPPSIPLTPKGTACADGKAAPQTTAPELWKSAGWNSLNFSASRALRYQYEWVSDGNSFTARAIGDLDCDGVTSTFEEFGAMNSEGDVQRDPKGPRRIRELE